MDHHSESPSSKEDEIFMKIFKYYKSNKPKPSLDKVLSTEIATDKVVFFISFHYFPMILFLLCM